MSSNALRLIQSEYRSDSEESDNENPTDNEIKISSESSSSEWSPSSDDEVKETTEEPNKAPKTYPKTKGELTVEDLPPIEKLSISVGSEELCQLGNVVSIVDQLVVVQSFRNMPALDLDSVLFFSDGQSLGQIFDVFGPVVEPRYAVRFNDNQQINELHIEVGTPIYFAPQKQQPITGFVFAEHLRQLKGSDASWKHNNEPPEGVVEYSDDESERFHKLKQKAKRRPQSSPNKPINYHKKQHYYKVPPNTPTTTKIQNTGPSHTSNNANATQNYALNYL